MTEPRAERPPARRRRRERRLPVWLARFTARSLRRSNILTSVLLGVVSLLIAFFAFFASQYSDSSADLDSTANRLSVAETEQSQAAYSDHAKDAVIWAQIYASGQSLADSPLTPLLSQAWQDAVSRSATSNGGTAEANPLDSRYFTELTIETRATNDLVTTTLQAARDAGATSSRLTGASVIFSAALLLLTVASTTSRESGRLALNAAALGIMIVAVLIGAAPLIFA